MIPENPTEADVAALVTQCDIAEFMDKTLFDPKHPFCGQARYIYCRYLADGYFEECNKAALGRAYNLAATLVYSRARRFMDSPS
jgi:hypothetical protein